MKTALQAIGLALTALIGLWALGHGIVLGVSVHQRYGENQDILSILVESSIFIAGGICVVSVAVKHIYAWLTHHHDTGLM